MTTATAGHGLKKLLYFLGPLSADRTGWNGFRAFLESPLHVHSRKKAELLKQIGQVIHQPGENMEQKLCELAFPDKVSTSTATRHHLRRRLSSLLMHYFEYKALQQYQQDPPARWSYILQAANQHQWDHYFPWLHGKARQVLVLDGEGETRYMHEIGISDHHSAHLSRTRGTKAYPAARHTQELHEVETLFAIQTLKVHCNSLSEALLQGEEAITISPLTQALLQQIGDHLDHFPALAQLYHLVFLGLTEPDRASHYHALKAALFRHASALSQGEIQILIQHTTNSCIRHYNLCKSTGNQADTNRFQQELIELYDFQLEQGTLFREEDGKPAMNRGDFKNLVVYFCKMGALGWVEHFINTHHEKIPGNLKVGARIFMQAILEYYREEYQKAESLILDALGELKRSTDRAYFLSARGYYLRILYVRRKTEDCLREAMNLAKSIRLDPELSLVEQKKHLQFYLYVQALCKLRGMPPSEKKQALARLEQKIARGTPSLSRNWLQEQTRRARAE